MSLEVDAVANEGPDRGRRRIRVVDLRVVAPEVVDHQHHDVRAGRGRCAYIIWIGAWEYVGAVHELVVKAEASV